MLEENYQKYFDVYVMNVLNLNEYDEIIRNSGLLFGHSITINNNWNLEYIRCPNKFNLTCLTEEDKNILCSDATATKKNEIIMRTYKDALKLDGVNFVAYDSSDDEAIIKNGTLVLELVYGKNTAKLEKEQYIENMRKQDELLTNIVKEIEDRISSRLQIPGKVLIVRAV
jgi:hypothetical protein